MYRYSKYRINSHHFKENFIFSGLFSYLSMLWKMYHFTELVQICAAAKFMIFQYFLCGNLYMRKVILKIFLIRGCWKLAFYKVQSFNKILRIFLTCTDNQKIRKNLKSGQFFKFYHIIDVDLFVYLKNHYLKIHRNICQNATFWKIISQTGKRLEFLILCVFLLPASMFRKKICVPPWIIMYWMLKKSKIIIFVHL